MPELTKAYLAEVTSGDSPTEVGGTRVDVQFNPTTLRVQLANRTAGGQQAGAQARQRPGTGEMTVAFDLVFDTADESKPNGDAVSVLDRTKSVERFVRPKGNQRGQEAPPRVTFVWADFHVQGTMESANIDLDFFDAKGTPLRAKVSVSIKGQDPRWTYAPAPPPAPNAGGASLPGRAPLPGGGTGLPAGTPGTSGSGLAPEKIAQALPGESLAQVAARNGLAPSLWRALSNGSIANPLKLAAGQEVPLPDAARHAAPTGASQDPAKATASLPLTQSSPPGNGSRLDPIRQGQAVAKQGGLGGAIQQQRSEQHQQGANQSLAAFGHTATTNAATRIADVSTRPWGQGVPLRPKVGSGELAPRRDMTQAGWLLRPASSPRQRPSVASTRPLAGPRLQRRKAGCGCGCGGRCGCK